LTFDAIQIWPSNCGGMNIYPSTYGNDGQRWWAQPPDGSDARECTMIDSQNMKEPLPSSNNKSWIIRNGKWIRITKIDEE
jgi:hypothetical protein